MNVKLCSDNLDLYSEWIKWNLSLSTTIHGFSLKNVQDMAIL